MEQLTKNQAVATSQEAVQNQNEPQLRDENAHNDKSVHGVLNPTYQAGLRRDAVQADIEAERKKSALLDALPSCSGQPSERWLVAGPVALLGRASRRAAAEQLRADRTAPAPLSCRCLWQDRKSTRLNSSHVSISYAVFCSKQKKLDHVKTEQTSRI